MKTIWENHKNSHKRATSFVILFLLCCPVGLLAQSGRVKPAESPAPDSKAKPAVVYVPTEGKTVGASPAVTPTPKPSPKLVDDDVIKVDSTLVPIPVSVVDNMGRAVMNLKLPDFELMVDGKKAEIAEITRSQTPVRLALLFDNSSSVSIAREFETKAAIRFLKQVLRPEKDQAALFSIATVSRLEQPLTKDISQLIAAIQAFPNPEGGTKLLDGLVMAAKYLRDYDGRRVIVIVSDGDDTLSDITFEETVRSVLSASCQIYIVKTTDFENMVRTGTRGGNANLRSLTAERRMQELSQQTGGSVYSPLDEDELNAAFRRISAELSEQYILNYYPEEDARSGDFHNISVNVGTKKDLTVRSRKGYYVPKKARS